jgi:hypothetical protein
VRRSLIAVCVAGVSVLGSGARAATCPAPPGAHPAVAAIDGRQRLAWIDERLQQQAWRGKLWAYGWGIGVGAAGVGSLIAVPFVAPSQRVDWYTSAATAAFGVIPFVLAPLKVTRDAPALRDAIAASPPEDDARVCAVLSQAERMLADDAHDERWQQAWWTHAGNVAFNAGVLLFLGLGYHHWTSGLVNGVSGVAVGEAIIFTQPTGAIDAAESYTRGELSMRAADARASRSPGWLTAFTF